MNRKQILAAAALAAITVLVYLPAMRAGFIWDDKDMVVDNAVVKSEAGLRDIWFSQKLPEYHPLSYSFFWVEWRLWGANPAGYHVMNILVHAGNVILLWLVLRKLRIPGSWLAALLFGVHPVCVASAAWIAEIKNTLSMFFYLVALLFYLRAEEEGEGKMNPGFYAVALAAFALALLAKISVVVFPAVLLLVVWWRHGGISRRDLARTVPFFLLALAAGLYGTTIHSRFTLLNDPLPARLLAGSRAVWFYLGKLLWPAHLTIIYPRWNIVVASPAAWIPGACLVALFYLFWRQRAGWGRALLFGMGYFVIALGPVLGVFKVVYFDFSQVADHFQYLAAPGVIALVVAGGSKWLGQTKWAVWAATAVTACLAVLTWQNEAHYAGMQSLWQDNLAANPKSFQALIYMGAEAESHGRYKEAKEMFDRVLEIKPNALEGHYNMGIVLDDLGRTDEAIAEMEKALRIKPDQADAHILMGWFLDKKGQLDEAAKHLREAVRLAPEDFRAHQNLGNLLLKQGRLDEAVQQLGEALKLKSDDPKIFVALGNAQGRRGDRDAAQACFQKALNLEPGNVEAQKGLAAVRQTRSATNAPPVR